MGIFDSDFEINKYIQEKIPELNQLENRELFKDIVSGVVTELYKQVKSEYDQLETRVFSESPKANRMPDLITCVVDRNKYDVTDRNMKPMFEDDLTETAVNAAEMIYSVKTNQPYYLYTCLIKADYLELNKLVKSERRFNGKIENETGEAAAKFLIKPNDRYQKKVEELYHIAKLNFLPYRSINAPYLYKLFDVYVEKIDEWDDQLEVKKITIDFDEFEKRILYDPLPLWNVNEVVIKANSYPQPAIDRKYYEHYLFKKQFNEGHQYLISKTDLMIRNIFYKNGDMIIICDSDEPGDWNFYEVIPGANPEIYENPLMSNEQNDTFSQDMIEYYGRRIKTHTELIRFIKSFKVSQYLEFADARIIKKPRKVETYSMEKFIDYEYRAGDRPQALEISFRAVDEDFYLNRDIMSFLTTSLQQLFPEYQCVGKLI